MMSPTVVLAQVATVAANATAGMSSEPVWPAMLKMVAGLLIILGLLYLGSALLRRWQFGGGNSRQGVITVKESRPLGAKRMLCLVEVRGREVLLGITPDRIEPLCHFDTPDHSSESVFDAELKHRQPQ